jgi:hypothetical protein
MDKVLIVVIALISFSGLAQETGVPARVKADINKTLYPELSEDGLYMAQDSQAALGINFKSETFDRSAELLNGAEYTMGISGAKKIDMSDDEKRIQGVSGVAIDDIGQEMAVELYMIEVKSPEGTIVIMSAYPVAEKDIYGGEGMKAVLSAVLVQ